MLGELVPRILNAFSTTKIELADIPIAAAHGELARLLKHLGETQASDIHQAKFVAAIGAELPLLPLPAPSVVKKD